MPTVHTARFVKYVERSKNEKPNKFQFGVNPDLFYC